MKNTHQTSFTDLCGFHWSMALRKRMVKLGLAESLTANINPDMIAKVYQACK